MSYCTSEAPSKFKITNDNIFQKFTFGELSEMNITSEELYGWSAPIDIIEDYQLYLISNDSFFEEQFFYNCTLPRFGPQCQYEFDYYIPYHSSLYEIIKSFYRSYKYNPTNLTCYIHLNCTRGHPPACLDWSEICDGKVDCINGNYDEEHCWQLTINECKEDEYQCSNGQCISYSFFHDDPTSPDCLDQSDENVIHSIEPTEILEPLFSREDVMCERTFLTSSCIQQRQDLLLKPLVSNNDDFELDECFSAFQCFLAVPNEQYPSYSYEFEPYECIKKIQKICPNMLYFPNIPILFGHVYTAYTKNDTLNTKSGKAATPYLCYNNAYFDHVPDIKSKISFKNRTCFRPKPVLDNRGTIHTFEYKFFDIINELYKNFKKFNPTVNFPSNMCNKSNIYQCINSSKCISIQRVMDTVYDCPNNDDENIFNTTNIYIITNLKRNFYKCEAPDKYIHQSQLNDYKCDCQSNDPIGGCEDENLQLAYIKRTILFQTICDDFIELSPITIEQKNETGETDETECHQWECNNIYTRCDGIWNCLHGEDEIGCDLLPPLFNCSSDTRICVSPDTNQFICLSIDKINDGIADCLGGTDERKLCRIEYPVLHTHFYCNLPIAGSCLPIEFVCDGVENCDDGADERFCLKNRTLFMYGGICSNPKYKLFRSDVEQFICESKGYMDKQRIKYFRINKIDKSSTTSEVPSVISIEEIGLPIPQQSPIPIKYGFYCHRGLDLRVWSNNIARIICLCPPSYYGNQCEYQNQRISLTLKFQALSDSWQIPFVILILLTDDNNKRIIHSYEQLTYLSIRDCKKKYNLYLIYSTRPKDSTKNYSIEIHIYEKLSLKYRGSLLYLINFPFLPVHRLGFLIDIPRYNDKNIQDYSNRKCNPGKCFKYVNNPKTFCQCDNGWIAEDCTTKHNCTCSSNSLCIGITSNNRPICICPKDKFGSRCYINDRICDNSFCKNNGTCIPIDDYMRTGYEDFMCICSKGFSGPQCEIVDNKLNIFFSEDMKLSESMFIHFILIVHNDIPIRTTVLQIIYPRQNSVLIYWSRPFHVVFVEFTEKNYYLALVQNTSNQSTIITRINPLYRCPNIIELFNKSFTQLHLIRRIKYYHLPCLNQSLNLSCFYDDIHLCLCYNHGQKRLANCFHFDHNMTFDCSGHNECENEGQCFQDEPDCPKRSICMCRPCFYGRRCQFTTSAFGLSLDAILGYYIIPNISFIDQEAIIKFSLLFAILFIIGGLINGILSLITFKNKKVCEVGCGLYLLGSSITSILTMIIFGLKYFILLYIQMSILKNRLFINIQCYSFDFLLQICLNMDQWLNACIAIERATTAIQGTRFVKKKSKKIAKRIILILIIIIIATSIHDPIYRRLIDEENNDDNIKRIWCIATYSSSLQIYNTFMNTFHFIAPFAFNFISAIILITITTRRQINAQTHRSYKEVLREQFNEHKHLFIAPIVLVIIALPRLIISYVSKCMKSTDDVWLYLIGYFISFIPPLVTFVVYVLPSKFYKKEYKKTLANYRTKIRQRFNLISLR